MDDLDAMSTILGEWRGLVMTAVHIAIILALSWLALGCRAKRAERRTERA